MERLLIKGQEDDKIKIQIWLPTDAESRAEISGTFMPLRDHYAQYRQESMG